MPFIRCAPLPVPIAAFSPWSSYGAAYIIQFLALSDDLGVE